MRLSESFRNRWWVPRWVRVAGILAILGAVLFAPILTGKPYTGKVIDAQTGQPVTGAAVIGYWSYVIPTPVQGTNRCLDAREDVTDAKGEFAIPRLRGLFFGMIAEFSIVFYKVGYQDEYLFIDDDWEGTMRARGFWRDNRAVAQLNPVAPDRLRMDGSPPHISCGRRDGKPLTAYREAQNDYRRALGLKLFKFE